MSLFEKIKHHAIEEGECFIWKRARTNGHPCMRLDGKSTLVRRALWIDARGSIKHGKVLRTSCGDIGCINPDHIKETSYKLLALSLGIEGMGGAVRGAKIAAIKRKTVGTLTEQTVAEIRSSDEKQVVIAKRLGVSQQKISLIRTGKAWKDYRNPFQGLIK